MNMKFSCLLGQEGRAKNQLEWEWNVEKGLATETVKRKTKNGFHYMKSDRENIVQH